jgi:UMF1 family MFS transporter
LLSSVSTAENSDFVSSLGYSLGYLGGGICFAVNVWMFRCPECFGLASGTAAVQTSFLMVSLWWALFSLPLLLFVHEEALPSGSSPVREVLKTSLAQLKMTLCEIVRRRNLAFFIAAYWLYIDGVYSVVKMAVDYGVAIGFSSKELIAALLLTQFVGFPAALFYSWFGKKAGVKNAILFGLAVYAILVLWASQMSQAWEYYCLAVIIGLVQGGVQALSRSFFLRLIPMERSGEYFGVFNLVGKFSSIFGPAMVGFVAYYSGSSRAGIASLFLLFAAGALLLLQVKSENLSTADC